jgi:succinate dehydrogenase / fumarate reductase, cytochrome b subunit
MRFLSSSVGRKILMAITGFFMFFFITVHLMGNSSIFIGPSALNTYAEKLHSLGALVWIFRGFMFLMLAVHVFFGIVLTLENRAANPSKYAVSKKLKATFSSQTMIWTGVLLLSFLIYHLLQFTFRITPDILPDAVANRPGDVYGMVLSSFRITTISLVYVAAMATLFFHLSHGIQSLFQTFGCSNDETLPKVTIVGKLISVLFLVGYGAIPVLILAGILNK